MNRAIRTLMISGVAAASFALASASVSAQQRMDRGNTNYGPRPGDAPGMDGGPMGMHRFGHDPMGDDMGIMRMAERLNLTQEQRDKIGKIIDQTRPKLRENAFAMMDSRKELHNFMKDGKTDDKKLRTLTRREGELMADMMYLRMKMHADIRSVLTDEQLSKMKERKGRFMRRGMRGDRPPMEENNS